MNLQLDIDRTGKGQAFYRLDCDLSGEPSSGHTYVVATPLPIFFLEPTLVQVTANTLQALSYFPVSLYIAAFTTSISSPLSATIVLSLFNSSSVIGRVAIGYLSDKYPYPWIMFVSLLGSGLAAFLLWGFADTLSWVFAFVIIFGSLVRIGYSHTRICPFTLA